MAMITGTHNISEMLTAHTIMGTKVVNTTGDDLGEIKDLAIGLDKGCINYAVLESGGFLGMGGKYFAIPWQAFTVDQDNEQLVLNVAKDKLQNAPGFDKDNWPDFADQSWMRQTNDYYGYGGSTGGSGYGSTGGGMGGGTSGY
jgi:sporulation protein YlmC with PRC-barrel domain